MLELSLLLSSLANTSPMLILTLLVTLILFLGKRYHHSALIFCSSFLAIALMSLIKQITKIPRPADMLISESTYRFPSGHATMASVLAFIGIYFAHSIERKSFRYLLYIIFTSWYLLVSWSRLFLNAHLPIDVIVGGLIVLLDRLSRIKKTHKKK
jgi:undecaprenyl-diphosphatase